MDSYNKFTNRGLILRVEHIFMTLKEMYSNLLTQWAWAVQTLYIPKFFRTGLDHSLDITYDLGIGYLLRVFCIPGLWTTPHSVC